MARRLGVRGAGAVLGLLLAAGGCTSGGEEAGRAPAPAVGRATAATATTPPADPGAVLQDVMGVMRDRTAALAAEVDQVRHLLPRGRDMADGAAVLATHAAAAREAIAAAEETARDLSGEGEVGEGADLVLGAADAARGVVERAGQEAAMLVRIGEFDVRADAVVAGAADAGEGAADVAELDAVAREAGEETAVPGRCPDLLAARQRWAEGAAARVRAGDLDPVLPYGEDRLAADAGDRFCWGVHSQVANGAGWVAGQEVVLAQTLGRPVPAFPRAGELDEGRTAMSRG